MFYKLLPQDHETIEHDSDDGRRVGGERDMVRVLSVTLSFISRGVMETRLPTTCAAH